MTIGPEPRMRILWMSLRRGNAVQEAVEQVEAVVRTGPGLRVVLDGPTGHLEQLEALDRAVVEVDVRERGLPEVGLPAHRLVGVDRSCAARSESREAVILGGDLDAPGLQVHDRVVGPTVAERKLERLQADGPAEELMPQADAPDGLPADDLADPVDHGGARG